MGNPWGASLRSTRPCCVDFPFRPFALGSMGGFHTASPRQRRALIKDQLLLGGNPEALPLRPTQSNFALRAKRVFEQMFGRIAMQSTFGGGWRGKPSPSLEPRPDKNVSQQAQPRLWRKHLPFPSPQAQKESSQGRLPTVFKGEKLNGGV